MTKPNMLSWLDDKLTVNEDVTKNCTAVTLVHSSTNKEVPPALKFNSGKQYKARDLDERFRNQADNYSQGTGGSQRFELLAFYDSTTPGDTFIFVSHKEEMGFFDEGPNEKGVVQQSMRHLEVSMRMALEQTGRIFAASDRTMAALTAQNEQLMQENKDSFEIVKNLIIEKANSQHDREMKVLEFERGTAERKKWFSFGPPLVNSLFGREIFPQSTEDTALIEAIAENLPAESIQKIAALLPPELWGPMANRLERFLKEKRESQESNRRIAEHASRNPEADAAGEVVTTEAIVETH